MTTTINLEVHVALGEKVLGVLRQHSVDAIVIGGFALAAHNYARSTEDLDLGVSTKITKLRSIRDKLVNLGYTATLREPDGQDSLGGVIDIEDKNGGFVQIVNFDNFPNDGFPAAIEDALKSLEKSQDETKLRVAPLPYLIALKLYAGGERSRLDVDELLKRNPQANLREIRELYKRYRLQHDGLF